MYIHTWRSPFSSAVAIGKRNGNWSYVAVEETCICIGSIKEKA